MYKYVPFPTYCLMINIRFLLKYNYNLNNILLKTYDFILRINHLTRNKEPNITLHCSSISFFESLIFYLFSFIFFDFSNILFIPFILFHYVMILSEKNVDNLIINHQKIYSSDNTKLNVNKVLI